MIKGKLYCFIFMLLALPVWAKGQVAKRYYEPPVHSAFTLQVGVPSVMRQDLIFSPFIHSGEGVSINLNYSRERRNLSQVEFELSRMMPFFVEPYLYENEDGESTKTFSHDFTFVRLNYIWADRLPFSSDERKGKQNWYFGGIFNNTINAMSYAFGRSSTFGYFASFGLGPYAKFERSFSFEADEPKHRIAASASFPLIAWVGRSPYLANDDEYIENTYSHNGFKTFWAYVGDGELQTLNRLQQLNFDFSYHYIFSRHWLAGLQYSFRFIHHNKPLPLTSFENALLASLSYNWYRSK